MPSKECAELVRQELQLVDRDQRPAVVDPGTGARRMPRDIASDGGEGMNERDDTIVSEQVPIRVATREEFDTAVGELFRSGQPIEVLSLEVLAGWDVDLEDDEGGMEGL